MIDQLARADRIPFRRRSSKTTKKERERGPLPSSFLFSPARSSSIYLIGRTGAEGQECGAPLPLCQC
jgi:hypothetical protein